MKITFNPQEIESAPIDCVRVRLTNEERGTKRVVREGDTTWLEIGAGTKESWCGKDTQANVRKLIVLWRSIIRTAKKEGFKKIATQFERSPDVFASLPPNATPEHLSRLAAEAYEMANFEFRSFKTTPVEGWKDVEEIVQCGPTSPIIEEAAKKGQMIGQAVNACRELSNTPGGHMTPRALADAAEKAIKDLPITIETLNRTQIEELGMGLLAGVGNGSTNEPTFTILRYNGADDERASAKTPTKPIVLAGKGITFDSGGLNLKPSSSIYEMHMDMSGAASVLYTIVLAAKLRLPQNVIALMPAAENLLGNNAMRPGDILTSLSGKTVEVTDTDAEGRLVLADAITYAKRFDPSVVLDTATLTGASMVALGFHMSGVMTRDDVLAERLASLGDSSGDYVWRLPLWDEYEDTVKSDFADIQNHAIGKAKYGGATNGGMFLWQFAKELDCPWAHIDIAPRMTASDSEELAKGAAGAPVRLLISFIESWKTT